MVRIWQALFVAAVAATIYLMLAPLSAPPTALRGSDKIAHFAVFAANGLLALPAFSRRRRARVLVGLIVLGVVLEMLQAVVPYRQASLADAVANIAGVGFAAAVGSIFGARRMSVSG